jgi:hypothetical protein
VGIFQPEALGDAECKIQAGVVNPIMKKIRKISQWRNFASCADASFKLAPQFTSSRASSGPLRNQYRVAWRAFAAAPLAQLEKSEGLFVDLTHRN